MKLWAEENKTRTDKPMTENAPAFTAALLQHEKLHRFMYELMLLYHIPINYLIPDKNTLPMESIRLFKINEAWVGCLLDGFLSAGRVSKTQRQHDAHVLPWLRHDLKACRSRMGLLMRTTLVQENIKVRCYKKGIQLLPKRLDKI